MPGATRLLGSRGSPRGCAAAGSCGGNSGPCNQLEAARKGGLRISFMIFSEKRAPGVAMSRAARGAPPCPQAASGPREQDGAACWGELGVRLLPQKEAQPVTCGPCHPPPIMHPTVSWLGTAAADSHGHSKALRCGDGGTKSPTHGCGSPCQTGTHQQELAHTHNLTHRQLTCTHELTHTHELTRTHTRSLRRYACSLLFLRLQERLKLVLHNLSFGSVLVIVF